MKAVRLHKFHTQPVIDDVELGRVLASEGSPVTVDGHRGLIYSGDIEPEPAVAAPELERLLVEARKLRRLPLWVRGPVA